MKLQKMHRTFPYMHLQVSVFYVRFLTVRNSLYPKKLFRDQMLNKKYYTGMKSFVQLYAKRAELVNSSQLNMVITTKICVCTEQMNFEIVRTFVNIEIAVQFMIIITFETRD